MFLQHFDQTTGQFGCGKVRHSEIGLRQTPVLVVVLQHWTTHLSDDGMSEL